MSKPKGIAWLEQQTGESIEVAPSVAGADRHLSVRVPVDLASGLEMIAAERGLTVSQVVRSLIEEAVLQRRSVAGLDGRALVERLAADVEEVRRRLAG